jgi:hypothetical protein
VVEAPPPEPEPEPEPVQEASVTAPPEKPQQQVTLPEPPKEEPKQQQASSFDNLLKDVTKRDEPPKQESKPQQQQEAAARPTTPSPSKNQGSRVSQSLQDAIGRQIGKCWNVDIGTKGIEELAIEVRAFLAPDGTVQGAEVVDQARYGSDGFYRSAADRALRAVLNPRCQPLPLPQDAYDEWSVIVFTFRPSDML